MIRINIREAKTHLSRYLKRVLQGESVILCKRNTPVAEIRAIPQTTLKQRPIGLAEGMFEIPDDFYEPLPEELERAFECRRN
jgi:antitoxin (DNA-binding transcriptional repressor) of toxin-antitoxin stability system